MSRVGTIQFGRSTTPARLVSNRSRTSGYCVAESGDRWRSCGCILKGWILACFVGAPHALCRSKKQSIIFARVEDRGSDRDEFAAKYAECDDESWTIRYTQPGTEQRDAVHAVYAFWPGFCTYS